MYWDGIRIEYNWVGGIIMKDFKLIVTVVGCYQIGENEWVSDRISKPINNESVYELMDWAYKVLGKKISVNELQFSLLQE